MAVQVNIDWSRCATVPRQHQKDGVLWLLSHPAALLADEVGAGKSKQDIDTTQILYEAGVINTKVVICPNFARGVWADPNPALGEIAKHGWPSVNNMVAEYSVRTDPKPKDPQTFKRLARNGPGLQWIITNYEFIRRDERLGPLLAYLANRKFALTCDEAWALTDVGTDQWKAVQRIRRMAARIALLNGTPIADNPLDMFAQMKLLDPKILEIKYFSHFRAYYAVLKPNVSFPMITGWQNLDELRTKCAPYVLSRATRDCFDLPPILEPVLIEAKFSDDDWRTYKQMRDEMVAWLDIADDMSKGTASVAKQAIVKSMRLAQITSGFLGGIKEVDMTTDFDWLNFDPDNADVEDDDKIINPLLPPKEINRVKLDALIAWLERLSPVPQRILVWCRFRLEIERAAEALGAKRTMKMLYGGQTPDDRRAAVELLNPDIEPTGLVGVVGNPLAGGAALNLAGASLAVNLSLDSKLRVYLQARGRIDRPGQRNPIRYVDVVATGPKGQKTIDHHILAALRGKEDVASWTASTWRQKLKEE